MSIQLLSSALPLLHSAYLLMNGSSALPSFSPGCPAQYSFSFDPKAPPPLVPTLPPPSFLDRIWNLFSSTVSPQQVTIEQAVDENDLPTLSNWLGKGDEELADHLDPSHQPWMAASLSARIETGLNKLISRPAEEGNIPVVLKLLDRMQKTDGGEHGVSSLLETVYLRAIEKGHEDLIRTVFLKRYKASQYKDPNGYLLKTAIEMRPNLALELLGEEYSDRTLETAVKASIDANQMKILSALLDRPEKNELILFAARYAAENNKPEVLKDLFNRGLSDTERCECFYLACEHGSREAAGFLANQGAYLGDKKIVEKLLKWEILPTRFSQDLLKTRTRKEATTILQAYIRFGSIKDRDLIEAWPTDTVERFALFRAILVDRHAISNKMDKFLKSQFPLFSPEKQMTALRIAMVKDRPEAFLDALINSSSLSIAQKDELSVLQQEKQQFQAMKERMIEKREPVLASEWDPDKIREEVLAKGPHILEWMDPRRSGKNDDRFVYFLSDDIIGQIKTMPHLILKSCRTRQEAEKRFALIERIREACKRKNLTHLRVPQALLVTELPDASGKSVPVHLVIEEMLPIAGHKFVQVKELLHKLNQDPGTRDVINGYFRELTSLVCETGLTDLKPTNVPLLADGSGLAIVDSNMQKGSVFRALYTFNQKDHALIHWISPENYQALRDSLDQEDNCPKNYDSIAKEYEAERTSSYAQEKELARAHLFEYGNQYDAPIEITDQELGMLDPVVRSECRKIIKSYNSLLKMGGGFYRREVALKDFAFPKENTRKAFEHLKRIGKIYEYSDLNGHGVIVQG